MRGRSGDIGCQPAEGPERERHRDPQAEDEQRPQHVGLEVRRPTTPRLRRWAAAKAPRCETARAGTRSARRRPPKDFPEPGRAPSPGGTPSGPISRASAPTVTAMASAGADPQDDRSEMPAQRAERRIEHHAGQHPSRTCSPSRSPGRARPLLRRAHLRLERIDAGRVRVGEQVVNEINGWKRLSALSSRRLSCAS